MIRVQFWGTRGSITTPGQTTSRYGGNTACVELIHCENVEPGFAIEPNSHHLILDGGSALTEQQAVQLKGPCGRGQGELHFLISHYHWDHLIGFPFYAPMFIGGNHVHLYGSSVDELESSIRRLFTSYYSPAGQDVKAILRYHSVESTGMDIAGFQITATKTRHPGLALSFRIQYGSETIIYTPDHEVGDPAIDAKLVEQAYDADLWIINGNFTEEEKKQRQGWGHSSHIEATKLALEARVKTVVLFHHNPEHDDVLLDQMGAEAVAVATGTLTNVRMARDRMVIDVGKPVE